MEQQFLPDDDALQRSHQLGIAQRLQCAVPAVPALPRTLLRCLPLAQSSTPQRCHQPLLCSPCWQLPSSPAIRAPSEAQSPSEEAHAAQCRPLARSPRGATEPRSTPPPTGAPEPRSTPPPTGAPSPGSHHLPQERLSPRSTPPPTGAPEPRSTPPPTGAPEPRSTPPPTGAPEHRSTPPPRSFPGPCGPAPVLGRDHWTRRPGTPGSLQCAVRPRAPPGGACTCVERAACSASFVLSPL
ncbi:hypothetical protein QTO34_014043 [Cnephaeus nilssonii]|uniref:Uncharacterized protein n=1 Tax=Cnephaeus nilssonii TaxID=3371016 RepID=A0AA40LVL2_CNENI|nr:hypothetical protein QTO34_014043 [Eptesicus nilssonii]